MATGEAYIHEAYLNNCSDEKIVSVHATAIVLRASGILIRGSSGSGKSSLAEALMTSATQLGWFSRLVCDDRVRLTRRHDRVLLGMHPAIAGLLERRCLGIATIAHEESAILRLVVDLYDGPSGASHEPPRLPAGEENWTTILGLPTARMTARVTAPGLPSAIFGFLTTSGL